MNSLGAVVQVLSTSFALEYSRMTPALLPSQQAGLSRRPNHHLILNWIDCRRRHSFLYLLLFTNAPLLIEPDTTFDPEAGKKEEAVRRMILNSSLSECALIVAHHVGCM